MSINFIVENLVHFTSSSQQRWVAPRMYLTQFVEMKTAVDLEIDESVIHFVKETLHVSEFQTRS